MKRKIKARVQFLDEASRHPLRANVFLAKLYDKDLVKDDYLGEAMVGDNGYCEIEFDASAFKSADNPFESMPDPYFVLYRDGHEIARTTPMENVSAAWHRASGRSTDEPFELELGAVLLRLVKSAAAS